MRPLLLLCALCELVAAGPGINLPINAQVPPVARVGEPFSFTFSEVTFVSANNDSAYSLQDQPGWMTLDGATRTFGGTPGPGANGSAVIKLVATDSTGSTTMPATFVITTASGPSLGLGIQDQLPAYGAYSTPNNILLAPASPLSVSFSDKTFENTSAGTVYYGISSNRTPLPSWINFDADGLSFTGITPQNISPGSQSFGIILTASNVIGFSDVVATFQVVVETHLLAFSSAVQIVNVSTTAPINQSSILKSLMLDGSQTSQADIVKVTAEPPSWLSLDPKSLALTGTAPSNFKMQNFTVSVTDSYGDTASTLIALQAMNSNSSSNSSSDSLLNPIGMVNATVGSDFLYSLNSTIHSPGVAITVDLGLASNWLTYDSGKQLITGHVPIVLRPQQVIVNITAAQGSESQSEILAIAVQIPDTSPLPTAAPTPSTSFTPSKASRPQKWIAAAVIGPIALVAGILLLLFCCLRARRRREADLPRRPLFREDQSETSSQYGSQLVEKDTPASGGILMSGALGSKPNESKISLPPKIPFPWTNSRLKRKSNPASVRSSQADRTDRPDSWQRFTGYFTIPPRPKSRGASELNRILEDSSHSIAELADTGRGAVPIKSARSFARSERSTLQRLSKKQRGSSNISLGSTGRLYSQVMWGFGHGRMDPSRAQGDMLAAAGRRPAQLRGQFLQTGPPGFGKVQRSWRNPRETQSISDWTDTTGGSSADQEKEKEKERAAKDQFCRQQPTIRPVWPSTGTGKGPRTSFLSPADPQIPIPKSAKFRQSSGNPFMSGRSLNSRSLHRTRSRSSSLNPPARPVSSKPESSPERRRRLFDHGGWPRVIDVHAAHSDLDARLTGLNRDPRFESAAPSECQSIQSWKEDSGLYQNELSRKTMASPTAGSRFSASLLAGGQERGPLDQLATKLAQSARTQKLFTRSIDASTPSSPNPIATFSESSSGSLSSSSDTNSILYPRAQLQKHRSSSFIDVLPSSRMLDAHPQSPSSSIYRHSHSYSQGAAPAPPRHFDDADYSLPSSKRSTYHDAEPRQGSVLFNARARQTQTQHAGMKKDDPANQSYRGQMRRFVPSTGTGGTGGHSFEDDAGLLRASAVFQEQQSQLEKEPRVDAEPTRAGTNRDESPYFL